MIFKNTFLNIETSSVRKSFANAWHFFRSLIIRIYIVPIYIYIQIYTHVFIYVYISYNIFEVTHR